MRETKWHRLDAIFDLVVLNSTKLFRSEHLG